MAKKADLSRKIEKVRGVVRKLFDMLELTRLRSVLKMSYSMYLSLL